MTRITLTGNTRFYVRHQYGEALFDDLAAAEAWARQALEDRPTLPGGVYFTEQVELLIEGSSYWEPHSSGRIRVPGALLMMEG